MKLEKKKNHEGAQGYTKAWFPLRVLSNQGLAGFFIGQRDCLRRTKTGDTLETRQETVR
jgi:hypothetical protein